MDKYIVLWANNQWNEIGFKIFPNYDEAYKFMKRDYENSMSFCKNVGLDNEYIDNEMASFYTNNDYYYYWNIRPLSEGE